jgi:hypothetical protein
MRTRFILPTAAVLILAACGGGRPVTVDPSAQAGATQQAGTPPPVGAVDCEALTTAAQQLFAVQLLAQLSTPDTVQAIRDHEIGNLDLDAFLAAMAVLHALDSHSSVLGEPKPAIEAYEKAARAAKELFATEPMTQAAIDAFNEENVGTIGEFLGHQAAISAALDEAGC